MKPSAAWAFGLVMGRTWRSFSGNLSTIADNFTPIGATFNCSQCLVFSVRGPFACHGVVYNHQAGAGLRCSLDKAIDFYGSTTSGSSRQIHVTAIAASYFSRSLPETINNGRQITDTDQDGSILVDPFVNPIPLLFGVAFGLGSHVDLTQVRRSGCGLIFVLAGSK